MQKLHFYMKNFLPIVLCIMLHSRPHLIDRDWSLHFVITKCLKKEYNMLLPVAPRILHIGDCGGIHHKASCAPEKYVAKAKEQVKALKESLFPKRLGRTSQALLKPRDAKVNGGKFPHITAILSNSVRNYHQFFWILKIDFEMIFLMWSWHFLLYACYYCKKWIFFQALAVRFYWNFSPCSALCIKMQRPIRNFEADWDMRDTSDICAAQIRNVLCRSRVLHVFHASINQSIKPKETKGSKEQNEHEEEHIEQKEREEQNEPMDPPLYTHSYPHMTQQRLTISCIVSRWPFQSSDILLCWHWCVDKIEISRDHKMWTDSSRDKTEWKNSSRRQNFGSAFVIRPHLHMPHLTSYKIRLKNLTRYLFHNSLYDFVYDCLGWGDPRDQNLCRNISSTFTKTGVWERDGEFPQVILFLVYGSGFNWNSSLIDPTMCYTQKMPKKCFFLLRNDSCTVFFPIVIQLSSWRKIVFFGDE